MGWACPLVLFLGHIHMPKLHIHLSLFLLSQGVSYLVGVLNFAECDMSISGMGVGSSENAFMSSKHITDSILHG